MTKYYLFAIILTAILIGSLVTLGMTEGDEDGIDFVDREKNISEKSTNITGNYIRIFDNNTEEEGEWSKRRSYENLENRGRLIFEINNYPNEEPSDEELERSWSLYNKTYENAESQNWFNRTKAVKDGFDTNSSFTHYLNMNFLKDNRTLDPKRPEYLIFYLDDSEQFILAGAMYMKRNLDSNGEQVGGPATIWHKHYFDSKDCFVNENLREESCPEEFHSIKSPEMLHVWFIDHPVGPFATNMSIPEEALKDDPKKMQRSEFIQKIK